MLSILLLAFAVCTQICTKHPLFSGPSLRVCALLVPYQPLCLASVSSSVTVVMEGLGLGQHLAWSLYRSSLEDRSREERGRRMPERVSVMPGGAEGESTIRSGQIGYRQYGQGTIR